MANTLYALYDTGSGVIRSYSYEYDKGNDYILFGGIRYFGTNVAVIQTEFAEIPTDLFMVVDGKLQKVEIPGIVDEDAKTPSNDDTNVDTEDKAISYLIQSKCSEINRACNEAIVNGIDVETTRGTEHFTLTDEDQTNISHWYNIAKTVGCSVPYHADDNDCRPFTAAEMIAVGNAATYWITYNLTYCNQLKKYVQSLKDVSEIFNVSYGTTQLTGNYLDTFNENMQLLTNIK